MTFFNFEADFIQSLRCIPMVVRYKLDTCGVKLKLEHWHQFNEQERQALIDKPCNTSAEAETYREFLQNLVVKYVGAPAKELPIEDHPAWKDPSHIPPQTQEKAQEFSATITPDQWAALSPLQRFVLIKLSCPSHENKNFCPALKEFNLV